MYMIVVLSCVFWCVYARWRRARGSRARAPLMPPVYRGAWPIIGHAHLLFGDNTHLCRLMNILAKESVENGGVMVCKLGFTNYYIITDPEDFSTAANQCLQKHFAYDFLSPWLGNGLVTGLDVSIWKRHRKLLSSSFSQLVLDGFMGIFNNQSRKLVNDLSTEVGKGPFHHSHYLDRIALESICHTAFGINTDETGFFDKDMYMKAVHQIFHIVTIRFQTFWMHSNMLFKYTKLKEKQNEVVKYLNDMCEAVLLRKQDNLYSNKNNNSDSNNSNGNFKAFIDLALELSVKGSFTNKEIWEEMNTIIVAGYETSGNSLMYTLMLLGSYPDIQEQVFRELQEVFGDVDRDVEKQDLSKFIYLEAVIKESLRLFAITPVMMRHVDKDVKLKNYTMPAGSDCLLFVCGLHRHHIWGADVDEFRPERWLNPASQADPNAAIYKAFAGFGVGRRLCMGKTYAMMSMKTTLAHVLRKYRITADVTKLQLKVDPLLKPSSGHIISIKLRT